MGTLCWMLNFNQYQTVSKHFIRTRTMAQQHEEVRGGMGYRFLGKGTGLLVSELCLGLMTLSADGGSSVITFFLGRCAPRQVCLTLHRRDRTVGHTGRRPGDLVRAA